MRITQPRVELFSKRCPSRGSEKAGAPYPLCPGSLQCRIICCALKGAVGQSRRPHPVYARGARVITEVMWWSELSQGGADKGIHLRSWLLQSQLNMLKPRRRLPYWIATANISKCDENLSTRFLGGQLVIHAPNRLPRGQPP